MRFCHANALAQQWFMTEEWQELRGVNMDSGSEEKSLTAQMAVAEIVTKMLGRCEIQSKGDTPKLVRCSVNLDIFRETVGVITPGLQYFSEVAGDAPGGLVESWWGQKTGTQIAHRWGAESAKHIHGGV